MDDTKQFNWSQNSDPNSVVYLRPAQSSDAEEFIDLVNDSHDFLQLWVNPPSDLDTFHAAIEQSKDDGSILLLVCMTSDQRITGSINISQIVFGGRGGGAGAGAQVAPSQRAAMNPSFNFVNGTNTTIRELYVSLVTDGGWGQDRLGTQVMRPGQRVPVSLPAGVTCAVDMRVVYMDGRAFERRRQQTCNLNSFVWR